MLYIRTFFHRMAILIAISFLAGCAATTSSNGNTLLKSHAFAKKLKQPDVILIDVRTPEEFAAGHLPNAVLYDFNAGIFQQQLPTLNKQKRYLLYCRSAKRSDKAASLMKAAGFEDVVQLKGGIQNWKGATIQ